MRQLTLTSIGDTARLANWLGQTLPASGIEALYLYGSLGCGKTTLTHYLVHELPGGDMAEVSSPSFTIFHCYPTSPRLIHCDLYRCRENVPEELYELLEEPGNIAIVEWAEFLPPMYRATQCLDIHFKACESGRVLSTESTGGRAKMYLDSLYAWWQKSHNDGLGPNGWEGQG